MTEQKKRNSKEKKRNRRRRNKAAAALATGSPADDAEINELLLKVERSGLRNEELELENIRLKEQVKEQLQEQVRLMQASNQHLTDLAMHLILQHAQNGTALPPAALEAFAQQTGGGVGVGSLEMTSTGTMTDNNNNNGQGGGGGGGLPPLLQESLVSIINQQRLSTMLLENQTIAASHSNTSAFVPDLARAVELYLSSDGRGEEEEQDALHADGATGDTVSDVMEKMDQE